MNATQLLAKIAAAKQSRLMVRVTRGIEPRATDGYVVGASAKWLVLLVIGDGVSFAGYQALRLRDVVALEAPSPRSAFYEAVLRKRGQRRPRAPQLDLDSTQSLVLSASQRFPLVTLHREKADPEVCHIGRVISASATSVSMLEVDPDARWDEDPRTYRLAQVTRIDFGGPYEQALALVAEPAKRPAKVAVASRLRGSRAPGAR